MNLEELKQEIPFKWRVQSYSKHKAQASCVAYIDARDAMDLLDKVCGSADWQVKYKDVGGLLFASVGIYTGDMWVWKSDTGSESNVEKDKGHASDAFKRACVHWGIGRFLYSKKIKYIDASEKKTRDNFPYPVFNGQRVWDITKHFNDIDKLDGYKPKAKADKPPLKKDQYDTMIGLLMKGTHKPVSERMYNYKLTEKQEKTLKDGIAEAKKIKGE